MWKLTWALPWKISAWFRGVAVRGGREWERAVEMEPREKEKEPITTASEELSREFKTLVNTEDLHSLEQLQHIM